MFRYGRGYINAGTNEIHKWGKEAVAFAQSYLEANEAGWVNLPIAPKYWSIGTSNGKFGEYCRIHGTCFSVNKAGYAYAKAGTEKGDLLVKYIAEIIETMKEIHRNGGKLTIDGDAEEE